MQNFSKTNNLYHREHFLQKSEQKVDFNKWKSNTGKNLVL